MRIAGAGLLLIAALLGFGCSRAEPVAPVRPVVRLVRDAAIGEALALEYARRVPGIEVRLVDAVGSVETVEAIQRNDADVGFILGDVAYFAHLKLADRPEPAPAQLRGMAALQLAPIHLLVRPGLEVRDIGDLRGLRIGAGSAFSGETLLAGLLFSAYGLGREVAQQRPRVDLLAGVDASFATAYYPAPTVLRATAAGARLLPIDGAIAEQLRREYPFVQPVKIPANTYPGQKESIRTLGVDRLLVCRSDLDEWIVHDLTRYFLEALPNLTAVVRTSLRLTDINLASATPIPLHKGAAQYYRERELTR